MQIAKKRKSVIYVEMRLKVLSLQFEQAEIFLEDAIARHEAHDLDPRRLKKLQGVLPKMRGVITRELEALLPN